MIQIALTVVIGFLALPPHPLDNVLDNKKVPPKEAQKKILASKEFKAVVEKAVKAASGEHPEIGPTYAQRVRWSIGNQLNPFPDETDDENGDETDDENGDETDDENGDETDDDKEDLNEALPPHPLDGDIKKGAKAADIIKEFGKSKAFSEVIKKAVDNSGELKKGAAGVTFGQSVRVKISEDLLMKDDDSGHDENS